MASHAVGQRVDSLPPDKLQGLPARIKPVAVARNLAQAIEIGFVESNGHSLTAQSISIVKSKTSAVRVKWIAKGQPVPTAVFQVAGSSFDLAASDWRHPKSLMASGSLVSSNGRGRPVVTAIPMFEIGITEFGVIRTYCDLSAPLTRIARVKPPNPIQQFLDAFAQDKQAYIRVIGVDHEGNATTLPSNVLKLTLLEKLPQIKSTPAATIGQLNYAHAVQTRADFARHMVAVKDVPLIGWKQGQKVYISDSSSSSFIDECVDAVSDTFSSVASMVDTVSATYASLKAGVLKVAVAALNTLQPGLGDVLATPMAIALDYALVSCGIPPSLPNFDRLIDQGADYLIEQAATSAMENVPAGKEITYEVAKTAAKATVDEARRAAKAAADSAGDGTLRFDPDYMYRPARLTIELRNGGSQVSRSGFLEMTNPDGYFQATKIEIPRLQPGQKLKVPVFLVPSLDPDRWMKEPVPFPPSPTAFGFGVGNAAYWGSSQGKPTKQQTQEAWDKFLEALVKQEQMRASWQTIYEQGKTNNGSPIEVEFVLTQFSSWGKVDGTSKLKVMMAS